MMDAHTTVKRVLSNAEVRTKCHIGAGARCCRYISAGMDGFECMAVDPQNRVLIDKVWKESAHVAQAGPCADPFDATSEAKEV